MKFTKIATMLMLCAMSMNMMADSFTASARITVTSTNGTDLVTFMEKASYSDDAMDNGADAVKLENTGDLAINIYGIVGGTNYSTVAKQHLEGTKIGFKSNKFDTDYTMTFSAINGRQLYLEDLELDSLIALTAGDTYVFTVTTNDTFENRFQIYKPFTPDAGDLNICHQYGKLTINNNPYTTNIVVKNSSDVVVVDKAPRTTPQVIDLSALPAGRYTVEIGGQTLIIDVK